MQKRLHEIRKLIKERYPLPSYTPGQHATNMAQNRHWDLSERHYHRNYPLKMLCWMLLLYISHYLLHYLNDWSACSTVENGYSSGDFFHCKLLRQRFWFAIPKFIWMSVVPFLMHQFVLYTKYNPARRMVSFIFMIYLLKTSSSYTFYMELGTYLYLFCFSSY